MMAFVRLEYPPSFLGKALLFALADVDPKVRLEAVSCVLPSQSLEKGCFEWLVEKGFFSFLSSGFSLNNEEPSKFFFEGEESWKEKGFFGLIEFDSLDVVPLEFPHFLLRCLKVAISQDDVGVLRLLFRDCVPSVFEERGFYLELFKEVLVKGAHNCLEEIFREYFFTFSRGKRTLLKDMRQMSLSIVFCGCLFLMIAKGTVRRLRKRLCMRGRLYPSGKMMILRCGFWIISLIRSLFWMFLK